MAAATPPDAATGGGTSRGSSAAQPQEGVIAFLSPEADGRPAMLSYNPTHGKQVTMRLVPLPDVTPPVNSVPICGLPSMVTLPDVPPGATPVVLPLLPAGSVVSVGPVVNTGSYNASARYFRLEAAAPGTASIAPSTGGLSTGVAVGSGGTGASAR